MVSEKKAIWLQSVKQLKEGDVFEGKVNYVTDFGAFVDLRFPDGSYIYVYEFYYIFHQVFKWIFLLSIFSTRTTTHDIV